MLTVLAKTKRRWMLLAVFLLLISLGGYQLPIYRLANSKKPPLSIHERQYFHSLQNFSSSHTSSEITLQTKEHLTRPINFPKYAPEALNLTHSVAQHKRAHHTDPTILPQAVINNVKTFALFVGYPRSGHSILGSMMDAHPHMMIAHELFLLDEWWTAQETAGRNITKQLIFRAIHNSSRTSAHSGWRNSSEQTKGYSLRMWYQWQGRYNERLNVVGDKSGGNTAYAYMRSASQFLERYRQLEAVVDVPIRLLHVVRNPFDIISTTTLYEVGKVKYPGLGRGAKKVSNFVHKVKSQFLKVKNETVDIKKLNRVRLNDHTQLNQCVTEFFKMAEAVRHIIEVVGAKNVLEVHNYQLVADPALTMRRVCEFLGIACSEDYLAACVEKTFRTLSLSRQYVLWGREERGKVEKMILDYPCFKNYSFGGDT